MTSKGYDIVKEAYRFAEEAHKGQKRKGGNDIPYFTHIEETASIVKTLTDKKEVIAAAYLHDVVEDCKKGDAKYTIKDIEDHFGQEVANLVDCETENKYESLPAHETWRKRKEETINHMKNAPIEAKMIALGDKLSNMRSIKRDYEACGDKLWQRFNQKDKEQHGWYYRSMALGLIELQGTEAWQEFNGLVREVFGE